MNRNYLKLLLFDIDGTLIDPARIGKEILYRAVREIVPFSIREEISFAGKTDSGILREILGEKREEEISLYESKIYERYLELLPLHFHSKGGARLLTGVRELLDLVASREELLMGLLTGNIRGGARIKLDYFSLSSYFRFGVYGEASPFRNDLPGIALREARLLTGHTFSPREVVVIGDTIHDVACGLAWKTRTLTVATGHFSAEELRRAGAHAVFEDFSDPERVLRAILS